MDFKILKRLIGLVEKSNIDELEVEHDDLKVRIKKTSAAKEFTSIVTNAQPQPLNLTASPPLPSSPQQQAVEEEKEEAELEEGLIEVVSPMVGTFYSAPAPGKPAYIEEGADVKKGDILCVIEAMKLMNEIESPHDGKVVSIIVDNAQPVEFGEKLFLIRPH